MIIPNSQPLSDLYADDVARLHRAEVNRIIAEAKWRIETARQSALGEKAHPQHITDSQ
jgi:hypothetical protein